MRRIPYWLPVFLHVVWYDWDYELASSKLVDSLSVNHPAVLADGDTS